jgi:nitrate/TMAO reductase-like tetraheme cytochrome c subunit
MLDILEDNEFFKLLFKIIPAGIILADANGYVHAINPEGNRIFCVKPLNDNVLRRGGELLHCINAKNGCGSSANCENCLLRANAMLAINGKTVSRQKGKFAVIKDNEIKEFVFQVTAAPLVYKQYTMSILIIEDISLITELSGLIPICSSCHNIRNEKGEWTNISKYLQEHSEAQFTHDYCPDCSHQLLNKRVKPESRPK